MAEPDAAGPPVRGPESPAPRGSRPSTLAEIQRDLDRESAPLRLAMRQAERSLAPVLDAARQYEKDQQRIAAMVDSGIGRYLREIVGAPAARTAPEPRPEDPAGRQPNAISPPVSPAPSVVTQAPPPLALDAGPDAMAALVDRVVEAVVQRLAARPPRQPDTKAAPATGRRGRRRREISVGGVDAALEALAEEDPSVRALAARALAERGVPYSRRTIENCDTYKAWRRDLKALRVEAAADGMADVLDAGLARIRKKKPGRGRLVDPTIDPAVEKMTKEFLRLHGEEGLDGQ